MKKVNTLQKELQMIINKKKENISIETLSLYDFMRLKMNSIRENKIRKDLKKLDIAKRETILNCNIKLKYWFNNQNISCRKYCKIEERELYKKDKILYKLGYLDTKPSHPFFQSETFKSIVNYKNLFQNKIKKINTIKSLNKVKSFLKLPNNKIDVRENVSRKINTLAIKTAKLAISGYRTLAPSLTYLGNQISSLNIVQYARMVSAIAKKELATASHAPIKVSFSGRPFTEQEIAFRNSIRFVPTKNITTSKKIEHTQNQSKDSFEYTL